MSSTNEQKPIGHKLTITLPTAQAGKIINMMEKDNAELSPDELATLTDTLILVASDIEQVSLFVKDPQTSAEFPVQTKDMKFHIRTVFRLTEGGIEFKIGKKALRLKPGDPGEWENWYTPDKTIQDLIATMGEEDKAGSEDPDILRAMAFPVHTSQELDVLMRSAADGRTGRNWSTDKKTQARIYEVPGLSHFVKLSYDIDRDQSLDSLTQITETQDADSCFVILYVANLLKPTEPLPPGAYKGGWVDLLDIARKVGLLTREGKKEREAAMRKVWDTLNYGARAAVCGARSSTYIDKATKQAISTRIETPAWAFLNRERPQDLSLFPQAEVPVRVELVMSKEFTQLFCNPDTVQFLPLGERLGAIPPSQPSGAWARVVGLALMNFWRRNPKAALNGDIKPTRRELLTRFTPKKSPVEEVLDSDNPSRAVEYWQKALRVLVENDLLEDAGEAALKQPDMRAKLPRYNWQDVWLEGTIDLRPGPAIIGAIKERAQTLPKSKPKPLARKSGRKPR